MTIAYDRTGRGPTLVLMHPLGADRHVWAPVAQRLNAQRELLMLDLPGFGDSDPLPRTPTPAALADEVERLLQTLRLDRPHVAGMSLGGWVALELGVRGTAQTTTAVAPAGLWPRPLLPKPRTAHKLAGGLLPLLVGFAKTRAGRRLLLTGAVAHPDRVPPADAAHLVRAWVRAPGFIETSKAMRAGRFAELARIPCPVTLVWPEHDRLIKRPRSLPANVRSVELRDAGHVPVWDAPDELAAALLEASTARYSSSD